MRVFPAFFAATTLFLTGAAAYAGQSNGCPAAQPQSNMQMTFDAEFAKDGSIDWNKWRPYIGQHGPLDQEAEVYLPDNISVIPKVGLELEMAKRDYWDHHYTAAWVGTQGMFSQTYGHFEMLAKMPKANGIWPAMWLVPENGKWPPEIDVVEYVYAPHGKHPDKSVKDQGSIPETTLHWADANGQHQMQHAGWGSTIPRTFVYDDWDKTPPLPGLGPEYAGYHIYGIDWRPGSMVWLLDNKPVFCLLDNDSTGDRVPHTPMYVILSDSVAPETQTKSHWAGMLEPNQAFPLEFDVAYTRAYQFKDVQNEPHLALDMRDMKVSNPNPAPGDTITFEVTLQVGAADLGKGKLDFTLYNFFNIKQMYGMGSNLGTVSVQVPTLAANQAYRLKASYTLPKDLPAGFYGVDAKANYTEGPGNDVPGQWPRGIHYRQAATIQVGGR